MKRQPWVDVLYACRRIHERGDSLTSKALGLEAKVDTKIASAWLFKFLKFGYVLKSDKLSTGKRWSWSWNLTKWGLRFKAKKAAPTRLRIAANPPGNQG